jgi:hypothetical protein
MCRIAAGEGPMRRAVAILSCIYLMLISGCSSGPSWQDQVNALQPATFAQRGKAAIILSSSIRRDDLLSGPHEFAVGLGWCPPGWKREGLFGPNPPVRTGYDQSPEHPFISEVDAGTYELRYLSFMYDRAMFSNDNSDTKMARITVAAGEVVYLGHVQVVVDGVLGRHSEFTLAVVNNQDKARAALATVRPELASKMVTRLITPTPTSMPWGLWGG